MKKAKGSLTVEAAMIMPLVLLVFGMAINGGIRMYQECRDTALAIREEEEMDIIEMFYIWNMVEDFVKDED